MSDTRFPPEVPRGSLAPMRRGSRLLLSALLAAAACDASETTSTGSGGSGSGVGWGAGGQRATTSATTTTGGSWPSAEKNALGVNDGCESGPGTCVRHLWSQRFGDGSPQFGDAIATDADGNVIVAGYFQGTMDLGGDTLSCSGGFDVFLAKLDPDGQHVWSKRLGDSSDQAGAGVAVDPDGIVVITGHMAGTMSVGAQTPLTSAGSSDVYVVKYDGTGGHVWSKRFGDVAGQFGFGVALDPEGNVLVDGVFGGGLDFGGGALTATGSSDVFVAKLDSSGGHVWSRRFGGDGSATTYNLAVDPSGAVLVVGWFDGVVDFGGGARTSAGATDIFLVKLDADGEYLWDIEYGDGAAQESEGVASDSDGNILIAGTFQGSVDLGGEVLTSAGDGDIFVAKLDPDGNLLWSRRYGDDAFQAAARITSDPFGDIVFTGHAAGSVDFGGGSLPGAGAFDVYAVKLTADGHHIWSGRYGDGEYQTGQTLTTDPAGDVLLTGYIQGTANFGGGPLMSAGGADAFVAKLER